MKNETTKEICSIFLCHADEDKKHVRELYQKLIEAYYLPWLEFQQKSIQLSTTITINYQ
ncbi:hypothetical protein MHK_005196 [Candidatus Magnetomorum sp. HK-1]|nr:hypothetical protein MHK_005196 [Candidatus Magnetomorum sp. HK-1]